MRAKTINEYHHFERGLDPKDAMSIGDIKTRKKEKEFIEAVSALTFNVNPKKFIPSINWHGDEVRVLGIRGGKLYGFNYYDDWEWRYCEWDYKGQEADTENTWMNLNKSDAEEAYIKFQKTKRAYESVNFERNLDPKDAMGVGLKAQVKKGLNELLSSSRKYSGSRIATINLTGNRIDLRLEISDYGTPNFKDFFFDRLSKDYFITWYIKAKPRKYKNSWKNDWVFLIKPEFRPAFKACFDSEGYIEE